MTTSPPSHTRITATPPPTRNPLSARRAWLSFSALALIAGSASAQMSGMGSSGGRGGGKGKRPAESSEGASCAIGGPSSAPPSLTMVQMLVNERLNRLPGELALDAQARPAFERYAAAITQLVSDEVKRSLKPPHQPADVTQAIAQQITDASNRMAAWEDVQQASKALLSLLSPAQQTLASTRLIGSIEPKDWMDKTTP